MMILSAILLTSYLILLGFLIYGYQKIPENTLKDCRNPTTRFSIIIPFRNESKGLPELLQTIVHLNYPEHLFEIIFVDDASEDASAKMITTALFKGKISFKIIPNNRKSASPKKDAITAAISISKYEWILTTDADCKLPKNWLLAFDGYIRENKPSMLAGPVRYFTGTGLINHYQQLDNYSLQATTIGTFGLNHPILCNGANLAYKKEEFNAVSGFSENNDIASGDDIFLLEKFRNRNAKKVHFIKNKNAIVRTRSEDSWGNIINQRVRWASKTSKQKDLFTKLVGAIVFLINLMVLLGLFFCLLNHSYLPYYLTFVVIKIAVDFLLVSQISTFFRSKVNLFSFIIPTFIYPIITVIVVLKTIKGNYIWKGRTFV